VAARYADDEVGQLATTFDAYLQQLEEFVRREQEFTADASHELRTPLTVINGASELLLENRELPERARRQLERIARAGERMSQMLESLLLLARETPTGQDDRQPPYPVEEVVMEVVEQHRFMTREKAVTLRCDIVAGFILQSSRTALAIVLSNVVRNAINYTEQGEVVVRVTEGCIEISDSGVGIPANELEHIFDRHYRGSNARQGGSGIGLSIVKRICDRQHWQIDIASEPGHGTHVRLQFEPESVKKM
jgi:signal transduction histidine kinase